jgi:O-antigen ligase
LIGIAIAGIYSFRLKWPVRLKLATATIVVVLGLGIFAVRFHNYFAAGATSVGARFDYWRAAMQTTVAHPLFGTGPGTFQRSYAKTREELAIKKPQTKLPEMARLAHDDYLEQFSDSGIVGGISYVAWVVLALAFIGRRVWRVGDLMAFAIFVGLLGWFAQGLGEFGLYIPALAWTAFTLLGCMITLPVNQFDKKSAND